MKFEKNYYTSDEELKCKVRVDNEMSKVSCNRVVIKLIRVIKAEGNLINSSNRSRGLVMIPYLDSTVIAMKEFPGVPARANQVDFNQCISVFLDAID